MNETEIKSMLTSAKKLSVLIALVVSRERKFTSNIENTLKISNQITTTQLVTLSIELQKNAVERLPGDRPGSKYAFHNPAEAPVDGCPGLPRYSGHPGAKKPWRPFPGGPA